MSQPKGKQRSIHMDDETFDLLQSLAAKHKINNSSVVRMALAAFAIASSGPAVAQRPTPVDAQRLTEVGERIALADTETPLRGARDIALPDPKVSSFSVSGGKVRGKVPRNDREDDGLDF